MVADKAKIQKIVNDVGNNKEAAENAINGLYNKWLIDNVFRQTKVSVCCCEEGKPVRISSTFFRRFANSF